MNKGGAAMKKRKFPWDLFWMVVLITAAFASAALALKPLVFRAEKTREIRQDVKQFDQKVEEIQEISEQAEEPMPFEELYRSIQTYNEWLVTINQGNLTNSVSMAIVPFTMTDYGLPDEVFGVLRIPAMDLEMPIYLGANDANMAAGAAVLTQTSIPIGGINTNAVIAGHRGWNGYPYFLDIENLQVGDMVYIKNVWEELTYKVTAIRIVYPDDLDAILIQPGKDMVTLMTCHPPNTGGRYRYLVYCERTENEGADA
jgi:sortase A